MNRADDVMVGFGLAGVVIIVVVATIFFHSVSIAQDCERDGMSQIMVKTIKCEVKK